MAYAPDVLKHAIGEAHLLLQSRSLGTRGDMHRLLELAQSAFSAGHGEIDDDEVKASGLHWTKLEALGLASDDARGAACTA